MKWKQWTHGRQRDSYCLKISVTDAMDILERIQEGKKIPRKFQFNLGSIIKDFVEVNNKFKKDYGRSFNCTENELHLKLKRARNQLKEITRRIDECNGRMTKQQH